MLFRSEDEYEDTVNLASPDPPKRKSSLVSEQNSKTLVPERPNLIVDKPNKEEVKVKEERTTNREPNRSLGEETSLVCKSTNSRHSSLVKLENHLPETDQSRKDKVTDAAPNSPKRRKVLKTQIDDHGREGKSNSWPLSKSAIFSLSLVSASSHLDNFITCSFLGQLGFEILETKFNLVLYLFILSYLSSCYIFNFMPKVYSSEVSSMPTVLLMQLIFLTDMPNFKLITGNSYLNSFVHLAF